MSQTTEHAFESYVEEILLNKGGWHRGAREDWDKQLALFPRRIFAFIAATQPKLWESMRKLHGEVLEKALLDVLVKDLGSKGALHVLRHGFKFYGKVFRLAYFKPAHGLNYESQQLFQMNCLTVTRQVPCDPNGRDTVDMVLDVNGLPVATIELKNPGTGQNWRHAVRQYKQDRDPRKPLFEFKKRALVHFAVDPDEVYMATRLLGESTVFLPFNRGSHPGEVQCGAGNPQHPSGYRTGYFWEDVLGRETFMDILANFIFVEEKEEKVEDGKGGFRIERKETMIFPRYHQLDSVNKLIATVGREGPGQNYLIQHSAGSGKTNSISWLSHRLASLHSRDDRKVFDCVVVITDRQVLDRHLQEAVYQIEHAQGVVKAIDQDSRQLAAALVDGTKIVVTTLQKFPFVLRGLLRTAGARSMEDATEDEREQAREWEAMLAKRNYAIIADEAHSSQSGESARELKALLGSAMPEESDEEQSDWEDRLNQVMASRGRQPNLSFFAFTATPKGKTLELFGRVRENGSGLPEPFHLYSMRQAIEEGFILDVLQNYTTYATFFRVVKAVEDDPDLPRKKAARALAKFMTLHPHNIEQKTEVIVEHFRQKVKSLINGKAKAMVVASSRLHAVRYKESFDRYLKEHRVSGVRALVAFSGRVRDPDTGMEYTEPGMNIDCVSGKPISEAQLPKRFASPDYQVLLVANKYQTGFDQPLLCAMYVDKRLDGVQAVQTLSRLNRITPGKSTPFVLDFVNESEDIYSAFKPYYDATFLREVSDPHQLEALKHELDRYQIYHDSEVEAFARSFYKHPDKQASQDHAAMHQALQPAVDRFNALDDDAERTEFRDKLSGYVKVYAFMSQILPYHDRALEMLYVFARMLLPLIPLSKESEHVSFSDEISLEYYRLQMTHSGDILVKEGEDAGVKSPTDVGSRENVEDRKPLSEIIDTLNEKFGTDFTDEDRLFFEQIREKARTHQEVIDLRQSNPFDKFQLGLRKLIETLIMQRMSENDAIVTRWMDDKDFGNAAFEVLSKAIYESIPPESECA